MLYRTYAPAADLRPYVKCYWMLRAQRNPFPGAEALIPDGSIELIFSLDAPYERYRFGETGQRDLVKGSHLVGERTQPFLVEQLGAIHHVAIRFRPGGLYPFVRLPVRELTNRAVDAELVLGTEPREVEEQLYEADSDAARVALLNTMLRRRLTSPDPREALARAAARLMARTHGACTVADVCSCLGSDYTQLERSFLAVVGLRPKLFGRLMRFVGVLDALNTAPLAPWPRLALDFGYYDQAHFTREFKAFAGVPPSQFAPQPSSIAAMLTRPPEAATSVSNSYKTPSALPVTLGAHPQ